MAPVANRGTRHIVLREDIELAIRAIEDKIQFRINQKGGYSYASPHEIYGILAEEVKEVLDELQANDNPEMAKELLDVAIAAIWGYISIQYGYIERS